MTRREAVSHVDAAWLRMDGETNPMVITALLGFEGTLPEGTLDGLVARLCAHPRFRQRVAHAALGMGALHWEESSLFDPALHVHRVALPSPADERALTAMVSDVMSAPLDRTRPLWSLHVIEGVRAVDVGETVLVARIHHAVGDGVALVGLLLSLLGDASTPQAVGVTRGIAGATPVELARRAAQEVGALARLVTLSSDAPTPLKGEQSARKRAVWSRPFSLDAVKAASRRYDARVNDLLLAATAGALRAHLEARGARCEGPGLRAVVPVFLRGAADERALGNHFGLVFAPMPVGIASREERVREVKRGMDAIKSSGEALATWAVLAATGAASLEIERLVIDIFSRKASLLVTNVPGPPSRLSLDGASLRSLMVWAPTSGHIGVGVSLLSYAGSIRMGLSVDAALVPDPASVVREFERELEALIGG